MSSYWKNILLILGTTVGAGIFSLPQLLHKIGLFWFLIFLLLFAYILYRINWYYFQVIKTVKGKHQFSGYVTRVIDKKWGRVAVILHLFSTYGALIAFILIGGEFLGKAFGFSDQLGSQLFFVLSMAAFFVSGKKSESIDVIFSLIKAVMFISIAAIGLLSIENRGSIPSSEFIIPFESMGAFVFAFTGFSIIPELHKEKFEAKSIFSAQLLILIIYFIFTFALVPFWQGEDYVFGNQLVEKVFAITGFISVFTAYMLLAWVGRDVYTEDLRMKERTAVGLIFIVPFLVTVFQIGSFLSVLSLTGGVFLAGTGLLICWMYQIVHPGKYKWELTFIELILVAGMVLEITSFFK